MKTRMELALTERYKTLASKWSLTGSRATAQDYQDYFDFCISELEAFIATDPEIVWLDTRALSEYGQTFWRIWTADNDRWPHRVSYPYMGLDRNDVEMEKARKKFHAKVNKLLKTYKHVVENG